MNTIAKYRMLIASVLLKHSFGAEFCAAQVACECVRRGLCAARVFKLFGVRIQIFLRLRLVEFVRLRNGEKRRQV